MPQRADVFQPGKRDASGGELPSGARGRRVVSPERQRIHQAVMSQYEPGQLPDTLFYRKTSAAACSGRAAPRDERPGPAAPALPDAARDAPAGRAGTPSPECIAAERGSPAPAACSARRATALRGGRYEEAGVQLLALHAQGAAARRRSMPYWPVARRTRAACRRRGVVRPRHIAADKLNPAHHHLRATILQEQGALHQAATVLKRLLPGPRRCWPILSWQRSLALGPARRRPEIFHHHPSLCWAAARQTPPRRRLSDGLTAGRLIPRAVAMLGGVLEKAA